MERICYILGAGFSAPLGLPLMSDFIAKSRDMAEADKEKYGYFKEVLHSAEQMSVSKNYFEANLFNIEEVLSILEMQDFLDGQSTLKGDVQRYVKDVIKHHTPTMLSCTEQPLPSNWQGYFFGRDKVWQGYGAFVASLANMIVQRRNQAAFTLSRLPMPTVRYSVVTLNYDRALEQVFGFLNTQYSTNTPLEFATKEYRDDWGLPNLAKLHGSIDSDIIVLPTWRKGMHNGIVSMWKHAYEILVAASHIRFIGYSLPASDAYVKYLLKVATLKAGQRIKSIDVICRDDDGTVQRAYKDFISFKPFRFANARTEDYLNQLGEISLTRQMIIPTGSSVTFDKLESTHDKFMQEHMVR